MALTESKLRQIIREEAVAVMKEGHYDGEGYYVDGDDGDEDDWFNDPHGGGGWSKAERDHFGGEFDPDSDDLHDAIKDFAAVTGRDKQSVLRRYGRR